MSILWRSFLLKLDDRSCNDYMQQAIRSTACINGRQPLPLLVHVCFLAIELRATPLSLSFFSQAAMQRMIVCVLMMRKRRNEQANVWTLLPKDVALLILGIAIIEMVFDLENSDVQTISRCFLFRLFSCFPH